MTPSETIELLRVIAGAFPSRFTATADVVRIWSEMLVDLEPGEAHAALRCCLAESNHPPTIADIRTRVAARRAPAPDIATAWGEVRRAIGAWGRDREPAWSHPRIAAAVNAIGWRSICDSDASDERTLMAQFERLLKAGIETERKEANTGSLEAARSGGALAAGDVVKSLVAVKP